MHAFISEILEKKVDKMKAQEHFMLSLQRLLDRNWMLKLEELKNLIQSAQCSDEEALNLIKQFNELRSLKPKVLEKNNLNDSAAPKPRG